MDLFWVTSSPRSYRRLRSVIMRVAVRITATALALFQREIELIRLVHGDHIPWCERATIGKNGIAASS